MNLRSPVRPRDLTSGLLLGLVLIAFGAGAIKVLRRAPPARFKSPAVVAAAETSYTRRMAPAERQDPELQSDFVSHRQSLRIHAASLVELRDGGIRAFWYAGTDEGTSDVTIQSAVFDPRTGRWGPERMVASRESTQRDLLRFVKKLGNPVAGRSADGSLCLFYVTVSVGGWAGSSITMLTSPDEGATWSRARRMVTSPFFNLSTLVKAPPFAYDDGTMGLPVHHEFIGKFGEILRLDLSGSLMDKGRLSSGRYSLQPVVMVRDPERALVLMRYSGDTPPKRAIAIATESAGREWTAPVKSPLANSDAALAGLVLPDGQLLVALNNSEKDRQTLSLVVSGDGGTTWKTVHTVEDQSAAHFRNLAEADFSATVERLARATSGSLGDVGNYARSVRRMMNSKSGYSFEFSYPSLIRTDRGDFHLVYTWNEAFLKHVRFSQRWLDQRLNQLAYARLH